MERKIEDFTTVELKAICYDLLVQLENLQNNLKTINVELAKRVQYEQQQKNSTATGVTYSPNVSPQPLGSIASV